MGESVLYASGHRTSIVKALHALLPRGTKLKDPALALGEATGVCRVVFAAGMIYPQPIHMQSHSEIHRSLDVNLVYTLTDCERILTCIPEARLCIVGSGSAVTGSFDQTYASCKAALHAYVKWRKVGLNQQLVAVAPPLIADSYWVSQRHDYPECLEKRPTCTAANVATRIIELLYGPLTMETNNAVVHIQPTGGMI